MYVLYEGEWLHLRTVWGIANIYTFCSHFHWADVCSPYGNAETNKRRLRFLEFSNFNRLVLSNFFPSQIIQRCHSPDGNRCNQIDHILVKKRFRSRIQRKRIKSKTVQNKSGKCPTEEHEILSRRIE